jgi:hypothetical protein
MSNRVVAMQEELKKYEGALNDSQRRAILKIVKGHVVALDQTMVVPRKKRVAGPQEQPPAPE